MNPLRRSKEHIAKLQAGREASQAKRRAERIASGVVTCAVCKTPKPLADFPPGRTNRFGQPRYAYCKPCHSAYQRVNRMRLMFNLSIEDYGRMIEFQGGVCAICGRPPGKKRLSVDHNHKTGLIRGLLCPWCNRAIGQFRDDPERIGRTMDYLTSPPCTKALGAERYGCKGRVTNKAETRRRLNRTAA